MKVQSDLSEYFPLQSESRALIILTECMLIFLPQQTYLLHKGHFENPEVAHCIAVALFHSPGSAGVMFPDYFM